MAGDAMLHRTSFREETEESEDDELSDDEQRPRGAPGGRKVSGPWLSESMSADDVLEAMDNYRGWISHITLAYSLNR